MAAWAVLYSGSNLIGVTEFSLTLNATAGAPASKTDKVTAMLVVDVSALLAGDQFQIALYDKARSGDTQRKVTTWTLTGVQSEPLFMTPALMLGEGWDFTVKKVTGTDRTLQSSIRSYS